MRLRISPSLLMRLIACRHSGVAGLVIIPDPVFGSNAATIAKLALMRKLLTLGAGRSFERGGLFAFDEDYSALARRSAR